MEKECPYLYKQVINNDRDSCDQLAKESLKAYSRLIAAAPDLLEACKDVLDFKMLNHKLPTDESLLIDRIQAAIAKAEGR